MSHSARLEALKKIEHEASLIGLYGEPQTGIYALASMIEGLAQVLIQQEQEIKQGWAPVTEEKN